MKFTGNVRKVDESCDVSDKNIRLADRHILLNEDETCSKLKTKAGNL